LGKGEKNGIGWRERMKRSKLNKAIDRATWKDWRWIILGYFLSAFFFGIWVESGYMDVFGCVFSIGLLMFIMSFLSCYRKRDLNEVSD